jgi:hypothetical protein
MSAEDSGSDLLLQLPKRIRKPDIYASYPIWPCKPWPGIAEEEEEDPTKA